MHRREFLRLSCGGLACLPPAAARAAGATRRPLIGVLSLPDAAAAAGQIEAFREGLKAQGYEEGRNIALAVRYADGIIARLDKLAAELVRLRPDVIVTGTLPAVMTVHRATRTIPIVMAALPLDPVKLGLAESLERPGGNVTGFWAVGDHDVIGERLELLRQAIPGIRHVGVMLNPADRGDAAMLRSLPDTARRLDLDVHVIEVRAPGRFRPAFEAAAHAGLQALYVSRGPLFNAYRESIAVMATHTRLPVLYGSRGFVLSGGLMSYGPSLRDVSRRSAILVDRILKGARPGDLPIERSGKLDLVINLKTAQAIGLALPAAFVARADETIQ